MQIKEITDVRLEHFYQEARREALDGLVRCDGYEIKTNNFTLYVLIENCQYQCADNELAYFSMEYELQKFIGAILFEIQAIDTSESVELFLGENLARDRRWLNPIPPNPRIVFLTDKGELEFIARGVYNRLPKHGICVFRDSVCLLNL